jgi:hypothetical protein
MHECECECEGVCSGHTGAPPSSGNQPQPASTQSQGQYPWPQLRLWVTLQLFVPGALVTVFEPAMRQPFYSLRVCSSIKKLMGPATTEEGFLDNQLKA